MSQSPPSPSAPKGIVKILSTGRTIPEHVVANDSESEEDPLIHQHPRSDTHTHKHSNEHKHKHGDTHPDLDVESQEPDHSHSHSHGSMNMRGVLLHVLGDALGNVGVVASGLIIWLTTWSWKYYSDPVISLVITCIIFTSALPLGKLGSVVYPVTC